MGSETIRLATVLQSIRQCRVAIKNTIPVTKTDLDELGRELSELQKSETPGNDSPSGERPDISDTAARIRGLLAGHRIQPERFRISGKDPAASVEFLIRCGPSQFFAFLLEAAQLKAIAVSSVSIRSGLTAPDADITMRIKNGVSIIE
jgi:hypothetical protein